MAFSDKTIQAFSEAVSTAHADNAASAVFLLKNKGKDVVVLGDATPTEMMCAIAAYTTHVSEETGKPVSKILKTIAKGLKACPVEREGHRRIKYDE